MRGRIPALWSAARGGTAAADGTVADERWAGDMRSACSCTALGLGMLFAIDTSAGTLDPARAVLWCSLELLLFLVLVPPRVVAGPGWLTSRGLVRQHTVRTDRLVSVRWAQGGTQQVLLRDADGGRAEVDPDVLLANPAMWSLVHAGVRVSLEGRVPAPRAHGGARAVPAY